MTKVYRGLGCEVQLILASQAPHLKTKIVTVQARYWRAVHSEVMTHRKFSRNASSSRAIPVRRVLQQVWDDPAGPIHWGKNQPGMQARAELQGWRRALAKGLWRLAGKGSCGFALLFMWLGLHKQVANRLLEPWQYITTVITSTDWQNFLDLRVHQDAQPDIYDLADTIRRAIEDANFQTLQKGEWHLPYVKPEELKMLSLADAIRCSTARCARTSYLTHDKADPHPLKDIYLHDRLVESTPIHASPAEHQATPMDSDDKQSGNFDGWYQYRKGIEVDVSAEGVVMGWKDGGAFRESP